MQEPNAADVIMEAHHRMRAIFDLYNATNSTADRVRLISSLIEELKRHMAATEKVFLPRVAEKVHRDDIIAEIKKDNSALAQLIAKIEEVGPESEHFNPTVRLIEETVDVHVEAEEELLLPLAIQIGGLDMVALGKEMLNNSQSERKPRGN